MNIPFKIPVIALLVLFSMTIRAQEVKIGKVLPAWKEGYLDIHAINTGQGECTFFILPDGTTMLVDAGEIREKAPNIVPQKPNGEIAPYETYAKYIAHFMKGTKQKAIDYMLLTHFHIDHMGEINKGCKWAENKAYQLTGISGVGDCIPFRKAIDRGWPDYNDPIAPISKAFPNYLNFIKWQKEKNGMEIEQFKVGKKDQLVLVHNAAKYPTFEIRNIAANGRVWTGVEDIERNYFIPTDQLSKNEWPDENQCSIVFRVSYGKFDYFTGADLPAVTTLDWQNLELPVGSVTGPVEACKSNHHMNYDAMGVTLLKALRPQVVVVHNRKAQQPDIEVLRRILSATKAYPGEKDVFSTNFHPATALVAYPNTKQMAAKQGHIVIRVQPGGNEFYVYALDDTSDNYAVTSIHGPYICN